MINLILQWGSVMIREIIVDNKFSDLPLLLVKNLS
jgi:hypothetical protein